MMQRRRLQIIVLTTVLVIITILWIVPLVWMVDTAFKPTQEIFSSPPKLIPSHFTLDHINELLNEWPFFKWVRNSFFLSTITALGSLIVASLAAYSFSRLRWRGRDALFLVFLAFMLLPWEVNVIPLFFTISKLGFIGTLPSVAFPIIGMPIGVFLLRQFFINIPRELEDIAFVEGCSHFIVLVRIILPVSKPALAAFGIFIFNWAWKDFFWSMISLRDPEVLTLPVGLMHVHGSMDIDFGLFMAAASLAALPSVLIFLFLRRYIIRGVTLTSGIKG